MGFFSWKTLDGNRSISNNCSNKGPLPVVLLIPEEFGGEPLIEKDYEGYGMFGGKDAYQLLTEWNRPGAYTGDVGIDRNIGIDIGCYEEDMAKLKYPLKFVTLSYYEKHQCKYEDFEKFSQSCPKQGYFY